MGIVIKKRSREPKGWYIQIEYCVMGINLEPAGRYEEYDQDSKTRGKREKMTGLDQRIYQGTQPQKQSLKSTEIETIPTLQWCYLTIKTCITHAYESYLYSLHGF